MEEPETSVHIPPTKNFETMTMQAVAPSSCDFKQVLEYFLAINLRKGDNLRNSGAIKQELDEHGVIRVG